MEQQVVKFDVTEAAIAKMHDLYMELTVSDPKDEEGFRAVHDARMVVVKHRTGTEKRRKALKADALAWGRTVDSEAKKIFSKLEPIESHLAGQEKIVTDEKKRIKEAEERAFQEKIDDRVMTLSNYSTDRFNANIPYQEIATMSDDDWEEYHLKVKQKWDEYQGALAEEIRVEAERIAAEEAERKEQEELIRKTHEAQAKLNAELEAKQAEIAAKEKALQDEKERLDRIEFEKKAAEEAKIQAEKDTKEKAEREAKEAEEKKAAEEAEKARLEALKPIKQRAIEWVELARESLPNFMVVDNDDVRFLMVNTLDQIKALLDVLHRDIEEL